MNAVNEHRAKDQHVHSNEKARGREMLNRRSDRVGRLGGLRDNRRIGLRLRLGRSGQFLDHL
jgi:hypothetical protein